VQASYRWTLPGTLTFLQLTDVYFALRTEKRSG